MTKDLSSFSHMLGLPFTFSLGLEFKDKQMLGRTSGEDEMLLHYVLFGGKIAYSLKLTPHSIEH
jgi:hypothetical protein